ncbi:MAG: hypothetical protein JKP98_04835 [Rhodobacteraceae bacterium]|nr:hypothetical protein [Paracoccaceae bacterium]
MTTKAVADAELAALKAAMSDSAAAATGPEAAPRDGAANAANGSSEGQDAQSLQALLAEHGLTGDDMRTLLDQLSHELGDLPRNKPVLTALGAFALGFAPGDCRNRRRRCSPIRAATWHAAVPGWDAPSPSRSAPNG